MKKEISVFISHILNSIIKIESFVNGVSKEDFYNNEEKQSAVVRQIEIIGEAVKNLPKEFKEQYNNIEWSKIIRARDRMIHKYFDINLSVELPKPLI